MATEVEQIIDRIIKLGKCEILPPITAGVSWNRLYKCPKCGCNLLRKQFGNIWNNGGKWTLFECNGCGYDYGYRELAGWGRDIQPQVPSASRIRVQLIEAEDGSSELARTDRTKQNSLADPGCADAMADMKEE